jgi:hypothetical protein
VAKSLAVLGLLRDNIQTKGLVEKNCVLTNDIFTITSSFTLTEPVKEIQLYIICSWCNLYVAAWANILAISITRLQTKISLMKVLKYVFYRT